MITPPPKGTTRGNYVSYFCSEYYPWFVALGYPLLDLVTFPDGEWAIIQMYSTPVIPSQTQWHYAINGLRNVEPTFGRISHLIKENDPLRKEMWAREINKTKEVEAEHAAAERHALEIQDAAFEAVRKNVDLCNRIVKNGVQEMDLRVLSKRIPRYKF